MDSRTLLTMPLPIEMTVTRIKAVIIERMRKAGELKNSLEDKRCAEMYMYH